MQRYDKTYSDFYDATDPGGYPFGKAIDASGPDRTDGTPILASFFNDIIGMMQAIFKAAGGMEISGTPERVGNSDVWKALSGYIERNRNNVPPATGSFVGGVKIGSNISVTSDGTISIPVATKNSLGVMKAGTNINISSSGQISVPTATQGVLGVVKGGGNVSIDSAGQMSVQTATSAVLGVVRGGGNVDIASNGQMSVSYATTPSYSDNSTRIATTAWVRQCVGEGVSGSSAGQLPVGSIYMSTKDGNPASTLGYGTWTRIQGRFLLGAGANEANTNSDYGYIYGGTVNRNAGEKGGEHSHTLSEQEMPMHNHYYFRELRQTAGGNNHDRIGSGPDNPMNTSVTGYGGGHNNMPPYQVVYIWERYS